MSVEKAYAKLRKVHRIKKREVRLLHRSKKPDRETEYREINLRFGTIWLVPDRSIRFDGNNRDEYFKETRPALALETPRDFSPYSVVEIAPGTSKFHSGEFDFKLEANESPERMKKTTYFLLKMNQFNVQKNLEKKISELSEINKIELKKLLEKRDE